MKTNRYILFALIVFIACVAVQAQTERPRLRTMQEERYLVQPGDVLELQFRYSPEFNQTTTVQPDGYISLQVGGDVKVSGKNIAEVRQLILQKASERLQDPEAIVILKEFQKPYFVVAGEVVQPGKIEMRERVTAIQAIMLAGGLKESARSNQILLFRKINSETAEVKVLNLRKIKRTSDLENDLTLQAGDMLLVPRDTLSKIERFIKLASIAAYINPLIR